MEETGERIISGGLLTEVGKRVLALVSAEAEPNDGADDPGDHRVAGQRSGGAVAAEQEPQPDASDTADDGEDDLPLHAGKVAQLNACCRWGVDASPQVGDGPYFSSKRYMVAPSR
jgi:hypothetical protein